MVAVVELKLEELTPEIIGKVVSGFVVEKTASLEEALLFDASFESTWKWNVVEADRPLSTSECDVTSEALSAVIYP